MDDDELRARLAAQEAQIAALVAALRPAATALTVAELYARYEAANKARGCWPTIMFRLRPVVAALGERAAMDLRAADWTAYRGPRDEKGLAARTVNQELAWLKAMLRWGVREGLLPSEPHVCGARKGKQPRRRETAPTEADVAALLAEVARVRDRVIVLCACDSGMRRNEIRQLQWAWIDRAEKLIRLPDAISKGGRGRTVPATARQLEAIDAVPRVLRSPYVLTNSKTGGPFSKGRFSQWWRDLAELAGLQAVPGETRVHLHDGRHGYATNAARRGVRIEVIQEVLGHASLDQTRDYVQSANAADLAEARETFERGIDRDTRR